MFHLSKIEKFCLLNVMSVGIHNSSETLLGVCCCNKHTHSTEEIKALGTNKESDQGSIYCLMMCVCCICSEVLLCPSVKLATDTLEISMGGYGEPVSLQSCFMTHTRTCRKVKYRTEEHFFSSEQIIKYSRQAKACQIQVAQLPSPWGTGWEVRASFRASKRLCKLRCGDNCLIKCSEVSPSRQASM